MHETGRGDETGPAYDPFFQRFVGLADPSDTFDRCLPPLPDGHGIPRVVHQFWIGGTTMPDIYRRCVDHNRTVLAEQGIEHRLYGDDDVAEILERGDQARNQRLYDAVPAKLIACRKDLLMALVLSEAGGLAIDCSMYLRDVAPLFRSFTHAVRYRYYLKPKQRNAIPYALPCLFGYLGGLAEDRFFTGIVDGLERFWLGEDRPRFLKQYASDVFGARDVLHGWMGQYAINESLDALLAAPGEADDARRRVSLSWDRFVIDIDTVQTAYAIKRLCLGKLGSGRFEQLVAGHL